jgi:hypothetical protein
MRTLLAALVGGLVVFVWGAVAHMLLPLGELGLSVAPAEAEVVATLKAKLPEAGLYFLPDMRDVEPSELPASGPSAFLAWRPETSYGMGANLGLEFGSGFLAAWIAALLLGCGAGGCSVWSKGLMTMGLGLFGWLSISASYWTWYGFSGGFFVSEGIQQAVGWLLAGLAMGALLRAKPGAAGAACPS